MADSLPQRVRRRGVRLDASTVGTSPTGRVARTARSSPDTRAPRGGRGQVNDARAVETDRPWFSAIRDDVLNARHTQQPDAWPSEFEWDELPPPFDTVCGATHTFDLPFVFGNVGPSLQLRAQFMRANERGRLALADAMRARLAAIARSDSANGPHLEPGWPA